MIMVVALVDSTLTLMILVFVFSRYDGPQAKTNMVIVDIKLLSGFTADTSMVCLTVK